MSRKCEGCGIELQNRNESELGYVRKGNIAKVSLCERCFKIRNYHDYKLVSKTNNDYIPILENISKTDDLIILVVDLFNISKNLDIISKYLKNDILLVLTKRDILPMSVYDVNLLNYFDKYNLNIIDKLIISSKNNFNFDFLINKIKKYQKSKNVYVVGFTNAGKSTMINKLIYNYSDNNSVITTSLLPSTTLNTINIELDDRITLIDTPGLLDEQNIIDVVDIKTLNKIIPKKEIKPITYQIKVDQTIVLDDILRIDIKNNNNITFYMSNELKYIRNYKETDKLNNLKKHIIDCDYDTDIVINGLGFIKVVNKTSIILYTLDNVDVYTRESLI